MTDQQDQPLLLSSFPKAILHVDGDAFFAAVEQALRPELKGKPLVTGKERGIVACPSYEARALGVTRSMGLWEARRACPGLIVVPSDYETYGLFSKRMFDIMRRYTPMVEEYSIDEGFADITGLRRMFRCSYQQIAGRLQADIHKELGITVSIGLSLSKSLAKLASDFRKPNGFTAVSGLHLHLFLRRIKLAEVWGFGPSTVALLQKSGLATAYDFVLRPEKWARKLMGKIGGEIWNELRGHSVYPVSTEDKAAHISLSKGKTFTAPSDDRDFVYAHLVRNLEAIFVKLRRNHLRAREFHIALRQKDYREEGISALLTRSTAAIQEIMPLLPEIFAQLFKPATLYHSTTAAVGRLESSRVIQYDLFEDRPKIEQLTRLSGAVDGINERYGKHKVCSATSLFLSREAQNDRADVPWRKQNLLRGETSRRHLNIPRLTIAV